MTALLRTEGLMKAYGGVQALNDASIAVEQGTVAGLIGPNGSGKTTMFNVITGYERPDAGEVWLGDRPITNLAPDKVFAAGTIVIAWLVRRSRFGLQLRAIRDDEDRARGLGVRAMRVKLSAFVISGAITAGIGAVWFYYINQVEPQTGFDPLFDLTLVLMAFLGGYGSISGAVLGALIIEPLTLWVNTEPAFGSGSLSEILLGAVFLLVVLFMPRGIIPTGGELITRIRTRGRPALPPAAATGPASAAAHPGPPISSGGAR